MRKTLFTMLTVCMLLCSQFASAVGNVPHRLVYGYFVSNGYSGVYGLGRFYMDSAQDVEIIDYGDGVVGSFAGACADGIMYNMEYEYILTEGPVPSGLWSYDLTSGKRQKIGDYSDVDTNPYQKYMDMTYDYSTKTMYVLGFEMGTYSLFTIDLTTAELTKKTDLNVSIQEGMGTLACDRSGQLYGMMLNGWLAKIDKESGEVEKVANLGNDYSGMIFNQSMDFDRTDGKLYWACRPAFNEDMRDDVTLVRIDVNASEIVPEKLAVVGESARLISLFVTFVEDGEDAPAAPENLVVTPADGGEERATISFTTPSTTFGGEPLDNLKSVTIKRGDVEVATLPATAVGENMTFVDEDVTFGKYRYMVYATNSVGNGDVAYSYAYIGNDKPDVVGDLKVDVGAGCQSATLSWNAPEMGYNGGYFSQDGLRYRIVRYPDEVEIASGIESNSFTDTSIRRLGRYYYEVYAQNNYGETGLITKRNFVLGKAVDVENGRPLYEDFSDMTAMYNKWSPYDGNKDQYCWTYNTLAPTYQFRSSSTGAEYFINPGVPNTGKDADEWIVSPPFNVKAGHKYKYTITARSLTDEDIKITTGNTNEIEDQQIVADMTVVYDPTTDDGTTPVPFADYSVELPEVTADDILCVGLHLVTPFPADGFAMIQISGITISDETETGISSVLAQGGVASNAVYDLQGRRVARSYDEFLKQNRTKGIYVVAGKKIVIN